jgi:hypothetical protein
VLDQEAKTFAYRSAAESWGKHREICEHTAAYHCANVPTTSSMIDWCAGMSLAQLNSAAPVPAAARTTHTIVVLALNT